MPETSAEASKNLVEVQNLHVRFDVNKGAIFKKKIGDKINRGQTTVYVTWLETM